MKELVWVFGNSAAGKETFIRNIANGKATGATEKLGWTNINVAISEASIKFIGQFNNDPITKHRDKILTEVPELLKHSDVVLIKYQSVDSESGRLEELNKQLPDVVHRIILIVTPEQELVKRLPQKSWWNDDDVTGFISEDTQCTADEISRLQSRFFITKISGNPSDNYSPIEN